MFDAIQSVFTRVFLTPKKKSKKIILLGLDAAGKTTFLYKIGSSGNDVVTTIPTIGFNVETLDVRPLSLTCWDVGGCDKIRPLWRHYIVDISCLVYFIDSNDRCRLGDAREQLMLFLTEEGMIGVPLLVVANKQDLPNAMSVYGIAEGLGLLTLQDRQWHIMPAVMTVKNGEKQVVEWLKELFNNGADGLAHSPFEGLSSQSYFADSQSAVTVVKSASTSEPAVVDDMSAEVLAHERRKRELLWQQWLDRSVGMNASNRTDDDAFLLELSQYTLTSWDHLTHVRLGWIYLTRLDLERGFNDVERTIEEFIANSSNTNGKSFHPTMTRFWCHMIAFWLCKQRVHVLLVNGTPKPSPDIDALRDFHAFLEFVCSNCYPDLDDLAHGGLFKSYFTSDRIFSEQAKRERVQPNIRALPDLCPMLRSLCECKDVLNQLRDNDDCTIEDDLLYMQESDYWMHADAVVKP